MSRWPNGTNFLHPELWSHLRTNNIVLESLFLSSLESERSFPDYSIALSLSHLLILLTVYQCNFLLLFFYSKALIVQRLVNCISFSLFPSWWSAIWSNDQTIFSVFFRVNDKRLAISVFYFWSTDFRVFCFIKAVSIYGYLKLDFSFFSSSLSDRKIFHG